MDVMRERGRGRGGGADREYLTWDREQQEKEKRGGRLAAESAATASAPLAAGR